MDLILVFCIRYPVFSATVVEEAVFSPSYVSGNFLKNHVVVSSWIHIWVFYSVSTGLHIGFCASSMLLLLLSVV
jgi:hypothetical protein